MLSRLFLYTFLLSPIFLFGNVKSDSIWHLIEKAKNDTTIVKYYLELGKSFEGDNPDSAYYCYDQAIAIAHQNKNKKETGRFEALALISKALLLHYQGKHAEALLINSEAEAIAIKNNFPVEIARTENFKGIVALEIGELDSAMVHYQKASKLVEITNDAVLKAKIYSNIAIINIYQGNYDNAIEGFRIPIQIARKANHKELLAGSLMNMGKLLSNFGQNDSALFYYNESLLINEQLNDFNGRQLCYTTIANLLGMQGKYDEAIEFLWKSYHLSKKLGDQKNLSISIREIGTIYSYLGDYAQAINMMTQAIDIAEAIGDKQELAKGYTRMANFHILAKNYYKAIEYNNKTFVLYQEMKMQNSIAQTLSNLALSYEEVNRKEEVIPTINKALDIYTRINDINGICTCKLNLGRLYTDDKDFEKARVILNEALQLGLKHDLKVIQLNTHLYLSRLEFNVGNTKEAIRLGKLAYGMAKEIDLITKLENISSQLSTYYIAEGNYEKALAYSQRRNEYQDSIYNTEKLNASKNAEMRWQSEKKQLQIEQLEKEKELANQTILLNEAKIKRQRTIAFSLAVIGILAIASIVLLIQYNKKKRDLLYQKQLATVTNLKMQNIRNRISPHFFFNALISATLPLKDFPEHQKAFDNLVKLLRKSLENAENTVIALNTELEIVDAFIELQQVNVAGGFEFEKQINCPNIAEINIPSMLLQIPIENSIKHGLAPMQGEQRKLQLICNSNETAYNFQIIDNGLGLRAATKQTAGTGTGSKVITQTIDLLNQRNKQKMTITYKPAFPEQKNKGTAVEITVPREYCFELA